MAATNARHRGIKEPQKRDFMKEGTATPARCLECGKPLKRMYRSWQKFCPKPSKCRIIYWMKKHPLRQTIGVGATIIINNIRYNLKPTAQSKCPPGFVPIGLHRLALRDRDKEIKMLRAEIKTSVGLIRKPIAKIPRELVWMLEVAGLSNSALNRGEK